MKNTEPNINGIINEAKNPLMTQHALTDGFNLNHWSLIGI